MGTRHLIAVFVDGSYRVAQYGQWDGYPSGQGQDVLKFLKNKKRRDQLQKKAVKTSWFTTEELNQTWKDLGVDLEASGGNVEWSIAQRHGEIHPQLSRETGAGILTLVSQSEPGIKLKNRIDFAGHSLFCEWAYVIDFDKGTFEVFKGFNKTHRPQQGDRFTETPEDASKGYFPVHLEACWKLDDLPSVQAFLETFETDEEE